MYTTDRPVEKLLKNVVHDLRQPLGTIETSAYLLSRMFHNVGGDANPHVSIIERQVDLAAQILSDAVAELNRLSNQPAINQPSDDENLAFTNSETAAVT